MSVDAGRSKLYANWKELHQQWQITCEVWRDANRQEFTDAVWTPMEDLTRDVLEAIDQLGQLFQEIHRQCQPEDHLSIFDERRIP